MKTKSGVFQGFAAEQLENIRGLKFRRMFGGFGIYSDDSFFGLISREKLYFYTNDKTKERYEALGTTFFVAPGSGKALKRYYEVPLSVIEWKTELTEWAREAIRAKNPGP